MSSRKTRGLRVGCTRKPLVFRLTQLANLKDS